MVKQLLIGMLLGVLLSRATRFVKKVYIFRNSEGAIFNETLQPLDFKDVGHLTKHINQSFLAHLGIYTGEAVPSMLYWKIFINNDRCTVIVPLNRKKPTVYRLTFKIVRESEFTPIAHSEFLNEGWCIEDAN